MNLPIWIPKFYIEELERDEIINLGMDPWYKWKALAVEWFNNGRILYAWRIDNEDHDDDSGLLCATGKCCC